MRPHKWFFERYRCIWTRIGTVDNEESNTYIHYSYMNSVLNHSTQAHGSTDLMPTLNVWALLPGPTRENLTDFSMLALLCCLKEEVDSSKSSSPTKAGKKITATTEPHFGINSHHNHTKFTTYIRRKKERKQSWPPVTILKST